VEFTKWFEISPSMSIANVKLNVHDIERSLSFYHDLLGFQSIGKNSDDNLFLSPVSSNNKNYLLQLSRIDTANTVNEGKKINNSKSRTISFCHLVTVKKIFGKYI
jgi:catechol-2,3-dioxygenase